MCPGAQYKGEGKDSRRQQSLALAMVACVGSSPSRSGRSRKRHCTNFKYFRTIKKFGKHCACYNLRVKAHYEGEGGDLKISKSPFEAMVFQMVNECCHMFERLPAMVTIQVEGINRKLTNGHLQKRG